MQTNEDQKSIVLSGSPPRRWSMADVSLSSVPLMFIYVSVHFSHLSQRISLVITERN